MIFEEINTFISAVSSGFHSLSINKWRQNFLLEIFMLYLIIPGRINFKQMSRYSKHSEQRFRNQFKKKFGFITYNSSLIKPYLGKRTVISFDPSHITKSGKKTPYLGSFWSDSEQCITKGLEIAEFSLLDIDSNQSFHLEAAQTPPVETLKTVSLTLSDLSVDKVLNIAKTITTLKINLSKSSETMTKAILITKKHKSISPLCDMKFWKIFRVTHCQSEEENFLSTKKN